jgi:hypothetical protein
VQQAWNTSHGGAVGYKLYCSFLLFFLSFFSFSLLFSLSSFQVGGPYHEKKLPMVHGIPTLSVCSSGDRDFLSLPHLYQLAHT